MQGAEGTGRGMQAADTVTFINTPAELIAALGRGDPHIQILRHLNFLGFSPKRVGNDFQNVATLVVGSTVRSIRVRPQAPPASCWCPAMLCSMDTRLIFPVLAFVLLLL